MPKPKFDYQPNTHLSPKFSVAFVIRFIILPQNLCSTSFRYFSFTQLFYTCILSRVRFSSLLPSLSSSPSLSVEPSAIPSLSSKPSQPSLSNEPSVSLSLSVEPIVIPSFSSKPSSQPSLSNEPSASPPFSVSQLQYLHYRESHCRSLRCLMSRRHLRRWVWSQVRYPLFQVSHCRSLRCLMSR